MENLKRSWTVMEFEEPKRLRTLLMSLFQSHMACWNFSLIGPQEYFHVKLHKINSVTNQDLYVITLTILSGNVSLQSLNCSLFFFFLNANNQVRQVRHFRPHKIFLHSYTLSQSSINPNISIQSLGCLCMYNNETQDLFIIILD